MSYTPPAGDAVYFEFEGDYTSPAGDDVNFLFGVVAVITVDSISRTKLFDDLLYDGFTTTVIKWRSSADGSYRVELGGTGVSTGSLIETGNTFSNFVVNTTITDSDIEGATTFSGTGTYLFNIYVKSDDGIWTPYNQV